MKNNSEYLTKIFKTSPGQFTKKEARLIKYFLGKVGNLETKVSVEILQKALNSSPNNIQWILKTFLIANVQSKRHRSINRTVSTVNGRVYKTRRIMLKVDSGKVILEPKHTRQRIPMFPDRSGIGVKHVYQVEALKGQNILKSRVHVSKKVKGTKVKKIKIKKPKIKKPKIKKTKISKAKKLPKKDKSDWTKDSKWAKAASEGIQKALSKFALNPNPILNAIELIETLQTMLSNNMDSLDEIESGEWLGECTTARDSGWRFIVKFEEYKDGKLMDTTMYFTSKDTGYTTYGIYNYTTEYSEVLKKNVDVSTRIGEKKCNVNNPPRDAHKWVFDMYRPLSINLIKALNEVKSRKIRNLPSDVIGNLIVDVLTFKSLFKQYLNHTFKRDQGSTMGKNLIEKGDILIKSLYALIDNTKIFRGEKPKEKITESELHPTYQHRDTISTIDVEKYDEPEEPEEPKPKRKNVTLDEIFGPSKPKQDTEIHEQEFESLKELDAFLKLKKKR